jgi:hypothetical protein
MAPEVVFQLTASTIASIFCGASLIFWLLSIKAMSLQRLSKEPLISSQVVIGGFVLLGSIASIPLTLLELNPKHRKLLTSTEINFLANHISDLSRSMLQLEVDSVLLLLILNEVRIVQKKNNKRAILTSVSI